MIAQRETSAVVRSYPDPGHTGFEQRNAALLMIALMAGVTVAFSYDGKDRQAEVHAVGTSNKDGSLVCRAYQIGGEASRPLPQWTLFTISKMNHLTLVAADSQAPREGYAMADKQMSRIIAELAL